MERSNGMKPFRISTMCQLIEIICHATQLADEVCLLYGQSFNDISFVKNFSYKLTHGYSCVFGFTFERIVILRIQFQRYTVFLLFGCALGRATTFFIFFFLSYLFLLFDLMETSGIILCNDCQEVEQVVLVCPKHKLAPQKVDYAEHIPVIIA